MIGRALDRIAIGGLLLSSGTLLSNLARYGAPDGDLPEPAPRVSILVPARNEARSIERCVRSLLAQDYPAFEVIVLDDNSEDDTPIILDRLAALDPGLRTLRGAPLPGGWVGKTWACHQMVSAADGASEYLLFTDADTEHAPDALARAVAAAERDRLDLLSLMPVQRVVTLAERATVPLLSLVILGYLPLTAAEHLHPESLAAANGQFMLFHRDTYHRLGGHVTVRDLVSEDVALARAVKRVGGRHRLVSGRGLVSCRMYDGLGEVIAGFRRSYRGGLAIDGPLLVLVVLFNLFVYLLPFLRVTRSNEARATAGAIIGLRVLLARADGSSLSTALLHVPGMGMLLLAQGLAVWDAARGNGGHWKGRKIDTGRGLRKRAGTVYTATRRHDAGDD